MRQLSRRQLSRQLTHFEFGSRRVALPQRDAAMNPQSSSRSRKRSSKKAATNSSVVPKVKKAGKRAKKSVEQKRKVYEALNYSVNSTQDGDVVDGVDAVDKGSKGIGANLRKTLSKTKSQLSMISLQVQQQAGANVHERLVDETPSPSPAKKRVPKRRVVPVSKDLLDLSSAAEAFEDDFGNGDSKVDEDVAMEKAETREESKAIEGFLRRTVQRIWSPVTYGSLDEAQKETKPAEQNGGSKENGSCIIS